MATPLVSPTLTQVLVSQYTTRQNSFDVRYQEIEPLIQQGSAPLSEEQMELLGKIEDIWSSMSKVYRQLQGNVDLSPQELERYTAYQRDVDQRMTAIRRFIAGADAGLATAASNDSPPETSASTTLNFSSFPPHLLELSLSYLPAQEIAQALVSKAWQNTVNTFAGNPPPGYFQTAIEDEMNRLAKRMSTHHHDLSCEQLCPTLLNQERAVQDDEKEDGDLNSALSEHKGVMTLQQVETIKKSIAGNFLDTLIRNNYDEEALQNILSSTPDLPLMRQALQSALNTYRQVLATKRLPDPDEQSMALLRIASQLMTTDLPQALTIAHAIPDEHLQSVALQTIAQLTTDMQQAFAIAHTISNEYFRSVALKSIE